MNRIITLLTDFGTRDGYTGSVKGVIKTYCPSAEIMDVTHEIDPFDVRGGAFTLLNYFREYPKDTIHLAVVDPGVGSARKALMIRTRDYMFVGPDNGLFQYALSQEPYHAFEIIQEKSGVKHISGTFHARDIFAPAAAKLAAGISPDSFGAPVGEIAKLDQPGWKKQGDTVLVEPLSVDRFGNIIFSFTENELKEIEQIKRFRFKKFETNQIMKYYAGSEKGVPLVLWNSRQFLEVAINQGSAAEYFAFNPDNDKLELILT